MSEIINYTRLTTSDKLEDRFLTCQVYQPIDPEQAESGMIFSQIEIMNPWFPTSQIGQTVINTLIREYYRGVDTSELVNFENAIKKVNEALAQIAQNGETDWIGKLNSVLVLYNKGEIHFAQTGLSHAYLYRGTKINHITEGLDNEDAPHPLKTFTNITSGTLDEGDKVVIANSSFFGVIRPLELRRIITSFNPTLTAIESAKILKINGDRTGNAVFIELTSKEELANIPADQKIEAIYLDQSGAGLGLQLKSFYTNNLRPTLLKTAVYISALFRSGSKKIAPHLKKGWEITQKGSKSTFEKISKSSTNLGSKLKEKITHGENEEISQESLEKSSTKFNSRKTFLKFKNKIRRLLITIGFYSPQKSKMILPILIAIVLVLGIVLGSSFYIRSKNINNKELQTKSDQITSLQNSATISLTKGDQTQALIDYKQILDLAAQLNETKYASLANSAASTAKSKINDLISLTVLSAQKSINLDPDVISILATEDSIITVLKTGEIRKTGFSDSTFNTLSTVQLPSNQIIASVYLGNSKTLAFEFDNKKLATYNLTTKKWQIESVKMTTVGKSAAFGDNIYVLDPLGNQIYKEVNENGQFNSETSYLKTADTNLADSTGIAIDGNIFTISKDGLVTKYSRGTKAADFQITLPANEKVAAWSDIKTSENSINLFATTFESGQLRIAEVNKSGKFIAQYTLSGVGQQDKVLIDPEQRTVLVQQGEKALTFKF